MEPGWGGGACQVDEAVEGRGRKDEVGGGACRAEEAGTRELGERRPPEGGAWPA